MDRYKSLNEFLKKCHQDEVEMCFQDIEKIIVRCLPPAKKYRSFFANDPSHSIAKSWLDAGYIAQNVDVYSETIRFVKKPDAIRFVPYDVFKESFLCNASLKNTAITEPAMELLLLDARIMRDELLSYLKKNKVQLFDSRGKKRDFQQWAANRSDYDTPEVIKLWKNVFHLFSTLVFRVLGLSDDQWDTYELAASRSGVVLGLANNDTASFYIPFSRLYRLVFNRPFDKCEIEKLPSLAESVMEGMSIVDASFLELAYLRQIFLSCLGVSASDCLSFPMSLFTEMIDMMVVLSVDNAVYVTPHRHGVKFLVGDAASKIIIE